jgi:hypothetical protein
VREGCLSLTIATESNRGAEAPRIPRRIALPLKEDPDRTEYQAMGLIRRSRALLAIAGLLCLLVLSGCAGGEEAAVDTGQAPAEKAQEVIDQIKEEGGESAIEELKEHRQEYEAAQQEREEEPGEAGEQAEAEGAEVREAVQMHEGEEEAAEEAEERPEHERGEGRLLRED